MTYTSSVSISSVSSISISPVSLILRIVARVLEFARGLLRNGAYEGECLAGDRSSIERRVSVVSEKLVWSGDGLASGENGRFDVIDIPPAEDQGKVSLSGSWAA